LTGGQKRRLIRLEEAFHGGHTHSPDERRPPRPPVYLLEGGTIGTNPVLEIRLGGRPAVAVSVFLHPSGEFLDIPSIDSIASFPVFTHVKWYEFIAYVRRLAEHTSDVVGLQAPLVLVPESEVTARLIKVLYAVFQGKRGYDGPITWPDGLYPSLYKFQEKGVRWMLNVYFHGAKLARMAGSYFRSMKDNANSRFALIQIGALWPWRGVLLADEMGLGKTAQVLSFLHTIATMARRANRQMQPILVVAPLNTLPQWKYALEETGFRVLEYRRTIESPEPFTATLINYESLKNIPNTPDYTWGFFVLDEAHKIKNPGTIAFRHVALLIQRSAWQKKLRFVLPVTASPYVRQPLDLWSHVWLVDATAGAVVDTSGKLVASVYTADRQKVPREAKEWQERFTYFKTKQIGRKRVKFPVGVNWKERFYLQDIMQTIMLRRSITDPEVDADIPLAKRLFVRLEVDNVIEEAEEFYKLVAENKRVRPDDYRQSLVEAALQKIPATVAHVVNRWQYANRQTVLFTVHHEVTDRLTEALKEAGVPVASYDGRTGTKERKEIIEKFKSGELAAMVIGIRAGGVGLNLGEADEAVFIEFDWTAAMNEQAEKRVARLDSRWGDVRAVYFVASDNEERALRAVQNKATAEQHALGTARWRLSPHRVAYEDLNHIPEEGAGRTRGGDTGFGAGA